MAGMVRGFSAASRVALYVDGDPTSFWSVQNFGPGGNKTLGEYYTIAPGAPLPLERFVLRLPPLPLADVYGEPFGNYVPHHGELSGSATASSNLYPPKREYRPLDQVLGMVRDNLAAPIEMAFPLQYFRYVRWRTFPDAVSRIGDFIIFKLAYAELELYGRGFAGESGFETQVVDLGRPAILGEVTFATSRWRRQEGSWVDVTTADGGRARRWQAGELVATPDAQVDIGIRLKVGRTADPRSFTTYSDFGELVETDFASWQSLKPRELWEPEFVGWQGPVFDSKMWTGWSGHLIEGRRVALTPGRYFQAKIEMTSSRPTDVVRLDSLRIEILPLLSPTLVGELATSDNAGTLSDFAEVPVGTPVDLTFALRAGFGDSGEGGFDAIRIATSSPEFGRLNMGPPLRQVLLDPDQVRADSTSLTLFLPERVVRDADLQIRFRTVLYTLSARVHAEVFNRDRPELSQFIDEGDATALLGTDRMVIAAADKLPGPLADLALDPLMITPNGDRRNDEVAVSYTLFGLQETDVQVGFYTLSGRRVRQLSAPGQGSGPHSHLAWDGRDETGELVPPGLYLCQVATTTSQGRFAASRPVAVAY